MVSENGWIEYSLEEVTENFDSVRVPVKKADRRSGPYPYYGASGIVDHVDNYIFDGEFLLVAEDGENLRTRKTPIAFIATGRFWVNNHAHIVRGNHLANTRFLAYALDRTNISGYLSGTTMPKLTQGNLNRVRLSLPPRPIQEAIVTLAKALDDKIELNRRMNETLEAMARAIFKSWFVDFDPVRAKLDGRQPPGMDADTAAIFPDHFEHTELGLAPKGWTIRPVGEVVEAVGGGTPSTKESLFWDAGMHHWATPKDLSNLDAPILLDTNRKVTDAGLKKISSGLLPKGTLLLSSRAPVGYLAIAEVPIAVNQGFIAMKCDGDVSNYFMLNWCRENIDEIERRASGTTFQEISKRNFRPIPMIVPPSQLVGAFNGAVSSTYSRIASNLRESETLAATRDTLVPKLLSGEIRVRDAESTAGAVT